MTPATQTLAAAWTDARVAQLKRLWLEGRSASQVARELGGVTRNAVIGKVYRLGLSGRGAPAAPRRLELLPSARPSAGRPPAARRAAAPTAHCEPTALGDGAPSIDASTPRVPLLQLTAFSCRFGIGDPCSDSFGFCNAPRIRGSYCASHAEIAYRSATPARARADRELLVQLRRNG